MSTASEQRAESAAYAGVAAELYDTLRGADPLPGEYDFYCQHLSAVPGPHLEVGAGTGRILLRLLADGFQVEGLESSADMLRICRQKADLKGLAPVLHHQRMEEMALPTRYGSIFVPLVTLSLLDGPAALESALTRFHYHLRPGGQLLFSTVGNLGPQPGAPWWPTREAALNGSMVRVSQESSWEPGDAVAIERFTFESVGDPPTLLWVQELKLRAWSARQVTELLTRRGFERIKVMSGHLGGHLAGEDAILVFRARTAPAVRQDLGPGRSVHGRMAGQEKKERG